MHPCKRQQKLVERNNRSAASAETFEFRSKHSISGFSTSVLQASAQALAEACRARRSNNGFSRNSRVSSKSIEKRLQHKRASAQTSAEACRAKQSNSGFSRNSRVSSEAIEKRLQHKHASAQALAEDCRAKQSNSGLCSSSSSEAIEQRFSRSNRPAASTDTFKPQ